ncbi:MAG: FtsQ-type POTRA domain-containing protein [Eubacteriales bacterium]|nr:FtsQ-type POTRA domain-containing protein [Eubacteriales bacterium]
MSRDEEEKRNPEDSSSEKRGIGEGWDTWSSSYQPISGVGDDPYRFVHVTPDEFLEYSKQEQTSRNGAPDGPASEESGEEAAGLESMKRESMDEEGPDLPPETDRTAWSKEIARSGYGESGSKRKHRKRRRHHFFLYVGILLAALAALVIFLLSPYFTLTKIQVTGNHHYSDQEIIKLAGAKTGGNLFTSAHTGAIKDKLVKQPYISDAKMSRKLPDTLVIHVTERVPVAAAAYGGKYILIDRNAVVLSITQTRPKLTLIRGLTISQMDIGSHLEAEEKGTLKSMLKMLSSMEEGDFFFRELEISGSSVTVHITSTLLAKGNYSLVKKSVEDGSLQKVVNRLLKDEIRYGTITVEENGYMSFLPDIG